MSVSGIDSTSGGYLIVGTCSKGDNEHLNKMCTLAKNALTNQIVGEETGKGEWKIQVKDLTTAFQAAEQLFDQHTYLHMRQQGVELFVMQNGNEPKDRNHVIKKPPQKITSKPPMRFTLSSTCPITV